MRLSMRVWDLPVRLFHAAVTVLLIAGVLTWRWPHPRWHAIGGEALLALLAWRLVWGVVGSDTARWAAFAVSPRAPRGSDDSFGHAAAGGWLVPLLLLLLAVLSVSGLARAFDLHRAVFWLICVGIVLHIGLLAIGRTAESPTRAMISGKKRLPAATRAPRLASTGLAALILACAAGAMVAVLNALGR